MKHQSLLKFTKHSLIAFTFSFCLFFGATLVFAAEPNLSVIEGQGVSGLDIRKHKPEDVDKILGPAINRFDSSENMVLSFYKNGIKVAHVRTPSRIDSIVLTEFFPGKTSKGISIGASREAVRRAYGKPENETPNTVTYIKNGIVFWFLNNHVKTIAVVPMNSLTSNPKETARKKGKETNPGQFLFDMKAGTAQPPK